jgi:uncharacterized membrane protein
MVATAFFIMFIVIGTYSTGYVFQKNGYSFIKGLLLGTSLASGVLSVWAMNKVTPRMRVLTVAYSRYRKIILKQANKDTQKDVSPPCE